MQPESETVSFLNGIAIQISDEMRLREAIMFICSGWKIPLVTMIIMDTHKTDAELFVLSSGGEVHH
jgi:hypothetical protein